MSEKIWYVYRHLKPCGEVFYIGIGKAKNFKRAYDVSARNSFWKSVFQKYSREVQVLKTNLTFNEACEIEEFLIGWWGRRDLGKGTLTNLNNGGVGNVNPSEEGKKRTIKVLKERTGHKNSFFGRTHSEETKELISKANKGRIHTEEAKSKISKNNSKNKSKKVIDTKTNIIFNTAKEASEFLGVPYAIFRHYLLGKSKNKTSCVYLENYTNDVVIPNEDARYYKPPKKVIDTQTGIIYKTIKEASRDSGINYANLKAYLSGKVKNKTTFTLL